jgi:hypothetical protein
VAVVGAVVVGAPVDTAAAGADTSGVAAVGVNDGFRSSLAGDVLFAAGAAGTAAVMASAESAASAVSVFRAVTQALSPELMVFRLPCRSLLRPLSSVAPDESDCSFALRIVSAGSGTVVLDPASVVSSPVVASGAAASGSPEVEEFPLAPAARFDAPERELPVPVRDDDMMPLSTIVSVASPSGSAIRSGGAMMSGGWLVRPASSTPSSSVLNGAPMYLFVDTI